MKNFTVEKNLKLTKFLLSAYGAKLSYGTLQRLLRNKDIKVNGARVNKDVMLTAGDFVEVYYDGEALSITPVYSCGNVFVFDKPPTLTIEEFSAEVASRYAGLEPCHRLDRNTQGLVVFAKGAELSEMLLAFKNRWVDKYYLCEVYGTPSKDKATLLDYLIKDADNGVVKVVKNAEKGAVKIITEYEVVEKRQNSSVLKVKLVTGKTHQIRAHLASIGNFIIGDGKYGVNKINAQFKATRQRLTAYELKFNFAKNSPLYNLNGVTVTLNRNPF